MRAAAHSALRVSLAHALIANESCQAHSTLKVTAITVVVTGLRSVGGSDLERACVGVCDRTDGGAGLRPGVLGGLCQHVDPLQRHGLADQLPNLTGDFIDLGDVPVAERPTLKLHPFWKQAEQPFSSRSIRFKG